MQLSYRCLLWLVLCVVGASPLHSTAQSTNPAADDLVARLQQIDGVSASFRQLITNSAGQLLDTSSGTMQLAKPRFRWEIVEPFPQIIVADADELKIYDPDLEQLTIQQLLDDATFEVPLAILTRTPAEIEAAFQVTAHSDQSKQRYILVPKTSDQLYARVELTFQDEFLHGFSIVDQTGQVVEVQLITYQSGLVLQSDVFELHVPEGTDIVEG